jgi:hypothetical protein
MVFTMSLLVVCVPSRLPEGGAPKPGPRAEWAHGLDGTKARYAFVYGAFRRLHRSGLIACRYRATEWDHKEVELAAHELLQLLDRACA